MIIIMLCLSFVSFVVPDLITNFSENIASEDEVPEVTTVETVRGKLKRILFCYRKGATEAQPMAAEVLPDKTICGTAVEVLPFKTNCGSAEEVLSNQDQPYSFTQNWSFESLGSHHD